MTFLARTTDLRFRFELARDLGMTVGELEDRLTAKEYWFWSELYSREAAERNAAASRRR